MWGQAAYQCTYIDKMKMSVRPHFQSLSIYGSKARTPCVHAYQEQNKGFQFASLN